MPAQPIPFTLVALVRIVAGAFSAISTLSLYAGIIIGDGLLALYNLVAPSLKRGSVVPTGQAGAAGLWPTYVEAKETDSRSPCPGLNALANHGIIPRSGRGVSFREVEKAIRHTYNFAPTFALVLPLYASQILCRDYWTGKFDLADIAAHNGIEHDASLTRNDVAHSLNQSSSQQELTKELLEGGTGTDGDLTPADFSHFASKRREHSRKTNQQYTMSTIHRVFSSANSAIMMTTFEGRVKDLAPWLLEERIPDGWEPRVRDNMGLTLSKLNITTTQIELGIEEEVRGAMTWLQGGKTSVPAQQRVRKV
ncbi:Cloroperoxidase [Obba rivulosa]|uniref:Cloroperoxidase n=1 Tax=Obba rivulosa TaxID=1052685 RepID=A0A8E2AHG7_9APHY|nr:Cloroperoxidase [Obba rivulosa]